MKRILNILSLILVLPLFYGCPETEHPKPDFEDMIPFSVYDYIVENDSLYSDFLAILEKAGIDKTLSAYNPDGTGYTVFLPDNEAVQRFIAGNDQFSSLEDLLNDLEYVSILARYHVVNSSINADDFPFGALPEYTLSQDILTVSFVIETDTSYYKINNLAPVINPNIEVNNGYIHLISEVLTPVTLTTYGWIEINPEYSIFKSALDATGLDLLADINTRLETEDQLPFTLLMEADSVYNRRKIYDFDDLAELISPGETDYTSPSNPLYNFTAYHFLTDNRFLDDYVGDATNYSTFSEVPVNINGLGIDIKINRGKELFDTIVNGTDTTIIDFIGFYYDASNVLTQSGSIHFIDQILRPQKPSRATQTYEFYEEPLFATFRMEPGEYLVEDTSALKYITISGTDLVFVEEADEEYPAWGQDYIYLEGDFVVTYTIPKIVQGKYTVNIKAEGLSSTNAVVEVKIDGKSMGTVDFSTTGTTSDSYAPVELGDIDFLKYEEHTIEISTLIPGTFRWDYIQFEI
ncbi:MAG: fasciclin domain-containing protein [Bacteroidota bacterium]